MKAKPYIESRLRSQFTTVHDMLCGQNSSEFGWNPVNKLVTTETMVWDAYLEGYEKNAETADDVVEELDKEQDQEAINETDSLLTFVDAINQEHSNTSSKKRKKRTGANY